jgi:hypothetical protein
MNRLLAAFTIVLLLAGPVSAAEEGFFAPESEAAGWLWPAAFSFYACRTAAFDAPKAYILDTPRLLLGGRRDADSVGDLIADLKDPDLMAKDPIAAELRRRTGEDFGYSDSSSFIERQRSVSQWAKWARENKLQ